MCSVWWVVRYSVGQSVGLCVGLCVGSSVGLCVGLCNPRNQRKFLNSFSACDVVKTKFRSM